MKKPPIDKQTNACSLRLALLSTSLPEGGSFSLLPLEQVIAHLDKAVAPALKDKLYGTLTEYVRHFRGLLEERKALVISYTLFGGVDDAEIED